MWRWFFVRLAYFFTTAFVFETVYWVLPSWLAYHRLAKCFLWAAASNFVFELTKEKIFKKRVKPRNKAVFISGCDSGFGYLTAKELDSKGFHVFAGCLFPAEDGATKLKDVCSERLRLVHVDVTKDESIEKARDFIEQNLGTCELWAIVNNAGVYKGFNIDFSKLSDFRETFEVNVLGQVRMTKAFLPMLKNSRGRVVNINSMAGRLATAHMAAYVMSKHASVAFTECLRHELDAWDIQVVSVEPEFFKTPMTNTTNIRHYLEDIFLTLDAHTKAEYGSEYLDKVKTMMEKTFDTLSSPRIELVSQAIEMAIALEYPSHIYKPCGSLALRVMWYMVVHSPVFTDVFMKAYFAFWRIPKPKGATSKCR